MMMTLHESKAFMNEFLLYCELECYYSDHTVSAYKSDLCQFFDWNADTDSIETALNLYFGRLKSEFEASTVNRKLSSLRSFLTYLNQEALIGDDLLNRFPQFKLEQRLPKTLTKEDVNALIKAPLQEQKEQSYRDHCILELLYSTGLRVSELCYLKWSDLNDDLSWITVTGKGDKQRSIPLTESAKSVLKKYKASCAESIQSFLFSDTKGSPLSRQAVYLLVQEYMLLCGLKQVSPHSFRHSFATHMIEGGARLHDVQLLLGHQSIASTQIYTSLSNSYLKNAYKQAHPRSLS